MMNKGNKIAINIITAIIIVGGCVYSSKVEYNDDVLSGMSEEKYEYIHNQLGSYATQEEVVKEYIANQRYYDSINYY